MAQLEERPFPPGRYPVVVIGSGPGALQVGLDLRACGIHHAILSADPGPGGMFRRFPIFQRLISWTKRYPVADGEPRLEAGLYDWNSLIADDPSHVPTMSEHANDDSYFPTRLQMEQGLTAFAERERIAVRYDCTWEATRRPDDGFVLVTSDGEYHCKVAVFAVGMTQAWKPPGIPGLEDVPHYVETKAPEQYAGQKVFVMGKRNSGMELADGLLPWVKQLFVASPRPFQTALASHSVGAARARYLQPYEDHVLGGGNLVLDAAIERVERTAGGYRVHVKGTTRAMDLALDVDAVIAATGFTTPLLDLPQLGVATFSQDRLPAQTPFWESPTVPGIYFAGSVTQGAAGLMKYGIASSSGAVHGFRHNARVLARHIAEKHFDRPPARQRMPRDEAAGFLLRQATASSALWNQKSYLAHVVGLEKGAAVDHGLAPLAHWIDSPEADAAAIAVETDAGGDIHPAVYLKRAGRVEEHLLEGHPLLDFSTPDHRSALDAVLSSFA